MQLQLYKMDSVTKEHPKGVLISLDGTLILKTKNTLGETTGSVQVTLEDECVRAEILSGNIRTKDLKEPTQALHRKGCTIYLRPWDIIDLGSDGLYLFNNTTLK